MVRRRINKVKRTYTGARGILRTSNILQNPYIMGGLTAIIKNVVNGQPPIDVGSIQKRISQINAKNPLIYLLAGHLLHNKPLMTLGAFLVVDPPVSEDVDDISDEEIEAMIEAEGEQKELCIH